MLEGFLSEFPEKRMELEALQFNFQSEENTEEWQSMKKQCAMIQAVFQTYGKEHHYHNYLVKGTPMFLIYPQ